MEKARMHEVVVVIGAGSIGQACARRVGAGKHVLLADLRMGQDGAFITGSAFLMDGGGTASYFYCPLPPKEN